MTTNFQEANLSQYAGDRAVHTLSILTSSGAAYNLTGYTLTAQARMVPDDGDKVFDTASTSGMAIADATNGSVFSTGTVVLVIPAAITIRMPERCYYQLQGVASGSIVVTLAHGLIFTYGEITR